MSALNYELLLAYARLGLQHWANESPRVKARARVLGVDIATQQGMAESAVTIPFRPYARNGNPMKLIPMPCRQNRVFAAFFAPWVGRAGQAALSFDLVVLSPRGSPFAFRFEPGSQRSVTAHGYDHVQLNELLGQRQVTLSGVVTQLPTTYPAFPIPSNDPITRFLAMAVAMHGYPRGIDDVLDNAFKGQPNKRKTYLEMTKEMLKN